MRASKRSSEAFSGAASVIDTKPLPAGVRVALAALAAYKVLLSPLFAGSCRYVPSCATYTSEAIARHGVIRGGWLGARRICRCHPLGGHGLDPVPND